MTLKSFEQGLWYPGTFAGNPAIALGGTSGGGSFSSIGTIDAAGEALAFMGRVYWQGRPAAAKTMSTAGSKIHFRTAAGVTMASASTTVRIGLQDVSLTVGPPIQPDGTFDVYREFTGDSGVIVSADDTTLKSIALSTSGSKSVAHGDLIAVVWEMTARGGTDALTVGCHQSTTYMPLPSAGFYNGTTWSFITAQGPMVMCGLEADDGTLGIIRGSFVASSAGALSLTSGGTEYGLIFRPPFRCRVDAFIISMGQNNVATADAQANLYADPLGTPSSMVSLDIDANAAPDKLDDRWRVLQLPNEYELNPNTDYCLALKHTGASGTIDLGYFQMISAAWRAVHGLENCRQGSRTTGAFSETTDQIPLIGVGISALDTGQPSPLYQLGL